MLCDVAAFETNSLSKRCEINYVTYNKNELANDNGLSSASQASVNIVQNEFVYVRHSRKKNETTSKQAVPA